MEGRSHCCTWLLLLVFLPGVGGWVGGQVEGAKVEGAKVEGSAFQRRKGGHRHKEVRSRELHHAGCPGIPPALLTCW